MSGESAQAMENKARVYTPGERRQMASSPLPLRAGAHLFIDDVERFTERQIGLVRMKRDRYVSRDASADGGTLRTPLVTLDASRMTVNAKVVGTLRVRLLDADGNPVRGFDWTDSAPIHGDAPVHSVSWKEPLTSLRGEPARIEFSLRDGQLFGFELIR